MTALHWAAEHGDSALTVMLLAAHADVKARTRIGQFTPLALAARTASVPIVMALLAADSDANARTENGVSLLHLAAAGGSSEIVTALIAKGGNVNAAEPSWGQTPLIFAASANRADVIRTLLKAGADPNIHTAQVNLTDDGTREQAAIRKRNAVLVSFEPEKHRDTTRRADTIRVDSAAAGRAARPARTPVPQPKGPFTASQIQAAIDSGRAVLMSPVALTGAFTEQVDTINGGVQGYVGSVGGVGGLTALHHAARDGNIEATIALLDGGARINDESGVDHSTPLLVAVINGQFDVATVLVSRGADPNVAASSGVTPLYAVLNTQWAPRTRFPQPQSLQTQKIGYLELLDQLLAAGANPNARLKTQFWYFSFNNCGNANCGLENIDGTTVFWRAAYALDVEAMRRLIKAGADPKIPSLRAPAPQRVAGRAPADSTGAPAGRGAGGAGVGAAGVGGAGRGGPPAVAANASIDSAAKAAKPGIGVYAVHSAAGVGYGNGFAGNSHRHAPDAWMPAMKYLVEELHADVNERDNNGYTPLHHAAARGDNEMINYLISKGADVRAVSANFRTVADMANGPVQRLRPFPETVSLLEKLGSQNSHRCVGC